VTGERSDPSVGGGALMAQMAPWYPRHPIDLGARVRELPADGSIPTLPGWRWGSLTREQYLRSGASLDSRTTEEEKHASDPFTRPKDVDVQRLSFCQLRARRPHSEVPFSRTRATLLSNARADLCRTLADDGGAALCLPSSTSLVPATQPQGHVEARVFRVLRTPCRSVRISLLHPGKLCVNVLSEDRWIPRQIPIADSLVTHL